ncbi:hypothetical protein DFH09DRAFT_1187719 [Mycena vulgaris]|nr:hypothetical protein DFH09DRAFT_1187719 [Mycena vulgaris]
MLPPLPNHSLVSNAVEATEPLSHWPFFAGFVLVVYDHLLTSSAETHFIWRRPKRHELSLFLLIRYLVPSANIVMAVLTIGKFGPERHMYVRPPAQVIFGG